MMGGLKSHGNGCWGVLIEGCRVTPQGGCCRGVRRAIGAFVSISQGNLVCLRREGEARIPRCCLVG